MIILTKTICPHCDGSGFQALNDRLVKGPTTGKRLLARALQCDKCDGTGQVTRHNLGTGTKELPNDNEAIAPGG